MSNERGRAYSGPRQKGCDYFDDLMGDNSVPGAFDTQHGGMRDYDKCTTTMVRQSDELPEGGVVVTMHCRSCNLDVVISIPWDELYVGKAVPHTEQAMRMLQERGPILPQDWAISDTNKSIYPNVHCRCGELAAAHFTHDECGMHLNQAVAAGLVTQQRVLQYPAVQQVNQVLEQWQRAMQQQQR